MGLQRDYYVSKTGNNSTGDGTQESPWLTIQHAIDKIASKPQLNGFLNLYISDGVYAENIAIENIKIIIRGNSSDRNAVQIGLQTRATIGAVRTYRGAYIIFHYITFRCSTATTVGGQGRTIYSQYESSIEFNYCAFNSTNSYVYDISAETSRITLNGCNFTGNLRHSMLVSSYNGLINLMSGETIITDTMAVTNILYVYKMANITALAKLTLSSGKTITGRQYSVSEQSRIANIANFPSGTVNSTTSTGSVVL